jgi:dihydropteroate synthase
VPDAHAPKPANHANPADDRGGVVRSYGFFARPHEQLVGFGRCAIAIGFGKTVAQNFQLLARQADLLHLGLPILAGWSRKSALGAALAQGGVAPDPAQRQMASVAAALLSVERGASVVRVHDVKETVDALKIWQAMRQQGC